MAFLVNNSYTLTASEISKKWWIIDAENLILGRMAAHVVTILKGKHKPNYTPHMDGGDCIIIINAEKISLSGKKLKQKKYYRHTGYPGGIKETTPSKILASSNPDRIVRLAVSRMIGDGPMARKRLKNLKVFVGPNHNHHGQKPEIIDMKSQNSKNCLKNYS